MSSVLDETKQQQVIALGRRGWSLRRMEGATGVATRRIRPDDQSAQSRCAGAFRCRRASVSRARSHSRAAPTRAAWPRHGTTPSSAHCWPARSPSAPALDTRASRAPRAEGVRQSTASSRRSGGTRRLIIGPTFSHVERLHRHFRENGRSSRRWLLASATTARSAAFPGSGELDDFGAHRAVHR